MQRSRRLLDISEQVIGTLINPMYLIDSAVISAVEASEDPLHQGQKLAEIASVYNNRAPHESRIYHLASSTFIFLGCTLGYYPTRGLKYIAHGSHR